LAVGLDAVLETEQFPASVTDLDTSLTNVDGNNFSHCSLYVKMSVTLFSHHINSPGVRVPTPPFFIISHTIVIFCDLRTPTPHPPPNPHHLYLHLNCWAAGTTPHQTAQPQHPQSHTCPGTASRKYPKSGLVPEWGQLTAAQ